MGVLHGTVVCLAPASSSDSWIWPDCDGKQGGGKAHGVVLVVSLPPCAESGIIYRVIFVY